MDQTLSPAEAAELLARDRAHAWHPYASMTSPPPAYPVVAAQGVAEATGGGEALGQANAPLHPLRLGGLGQW